MNEWLAMMVRWTQQKLKHFYIKKILEKKLLGWSKSSFGFSVTSYGETQMTLWPTQYFAI